MQVPWGRRPMSAAGATTYYSHPGQGSGCVGPDGRRAARPTAALVIVAVLLGLWLGRFGMPIQPSIEQVVRSERRLRPPLSLGAARDGPQRPSGPPVSVARPPSPSAAQAGGGWRAVFGTPDPLKTAAHELAQGARGISRPAPAIPTMKDWLRRNRIATHPIPETPARQEAGLEDVLAADSMSDVVGGKGEARPPRAREAPPGDADNGEEALWRSAVEMPLNGQGIGRAQTRYLEDYIRDRRYATTPTSQAWGSLQADAGMMFAEPGDEAGADDAEGLETETGERNPGTDMVGGLDLSSDWRRDAPAGDPVLEAVLRDDWAPPQRHNGVIPFFAPPARPPFRHLLRTPPDTAIPLPRLDDVAPDRQNLTGRLPRPYTVKPIAIPRVRPNGKVSAGQYRPTTNHLLREVTDPRVRELVAGSIRDLLVYFFGDRTSPWFRMGGPTVGLFKIDDHFVEAVVPVTFPKFWPGLDRLPSRHALAFYHRGWVSGAAVVIDRFVDFGDNTVLAVFIKTEHECLRSLMLGKEKRTYKMLQAFLTQQLTVVLGMRVTLHLGVVPVAEWSRPIGGIKYFLPDDARAMPAPLPALPGA